MVHNRGRGLRILWQERVNAVMAILWFAGDGPCLLEINMKVFGGGGALYHQLILKWFREKNIYVLYSPPFLYT